MGAHRSILVLSSDGTTEATSLVFGKADTGGTSAIITVRVFNAETTGTISTNRLNVMRADIIRSNPAGEDEMDTQRAGGELVPETWLEARKQGDLTWVPLDEYANYLDLGAIVNQDHVTVELRLVVPSGADTFGDVDFMLVVRSR